MNKIEFQKFVNSVLRKLDRGSRYPLNCVKFGENESRTHILKKVNYILDFKGNLPFITEVYDLKRKHKADIVFLTAPVPSVIEIKVSEGIDSLKEKKTYWNNLGFKVIVH